MIIDTLIAVGLWSSAAIASVSAGAFVVNWVRYAKTEWAKSTGISFLKHCYRKHLQLRKSARKGYAGEHQLARVLEKVKGEKKLLFNVLIPTGKDKTTEIDAMMIHETGVYAFENKNYDGSIGCVVKGKDREPRLENVKIDTPTWDVVYNPKTKMKMYNPILQNEKHVLFIKQMLRYQDIGAQRFFSYVTFNDDARIKGAPLEFKLSVEGQMLRLNQLRLDLNSKIPQRSKVLSAEKINQIVSVFEPFSRVSKQERREHVQRVNEIRSNEAEAENERVEVEPFRVPLNDAISSAQNTIPKDMSQRKSLSRDYMNMFRG